MSNPSFSNRRKRMRPAATILVLLAGVIMLGTPTLKAEPERPPLAATWVFAIKDDAQGNPHGKVFLRVAGKQILIEPDAHVRFTSLHRAEYADHNVPATAIAACTGWWAGGGEDLFVKRRPGRLDVYRTLTDEQSPAEPYHIIRSIPVR